MFKHIETSLVQKSKLRSYTKKLKKINQEAPEPIHLYDIRSQEFHKYPVYFDEAIGIDSKSQTVLQETEMDEDCQSTDEIIESGVNRGLKELAKGTKSYGINFEICQN